MSVLVNGSNKTNDNNKTPRWQFRKAKKLEKRRKQRKDSAIQRRSMTTVDKPRDDEPQMLLAEKQKYEQAKKLWEEREEKYKLIEIAKAEAKAKEERAKAIAKKKWQEMLLNLPIMPMPVSVSSATTSGNNRDSSSTNTKKPVFKKFVESSDGRINGGSTSTRKTYRERFQERKFALKKTKKKQ